MKKKKKKEYTDDHLFRKYPDYYIGQRIKNNLIIGGAIALIAWIINYFTGFLDKH